MICRDDEHLVPRLIGFDFLTALMSVYSSLITIACCKATGRVRPPVILGYVAELLLPICVAKLSVTLQDSSAL